MPIAYIGIGSNLGDRGKNCIEAIRLLADRGITVCRKSSTYETEPWGVKDQPLFINMAIEIQTVLGPEDLLCLLKETEKEMGRTATIKWGPRVIDLDLLLYDDLVIKGPGLQIPHPRLHERSFVLKPLAEIAPDKVHPVLRKTVKALQAEVK